MSKAARAIPGQHVMSRLFARVASRPAIGPSPAFFARFGLDDPWAASGNWAGEDSRNPLFTFLSADAYYRDLARMRGARERLMARFAAMEAGPLAASAGFAHRLPEPVKPRTSSFATGAMSSPVLLAAAPLPEPEANETAGRWVERRKEKATREKKAPEARPLARALRREGPAGDVIGAALRDAGVSTRDRGTPALATAMREARGLSAEGQAEIARRVVRSMRGPARHAARAAMDEMVETQDSRPISVALSRQPAVGRSRKGLRPVLASSPSLVVLQHEEAPEVAKAAEPRVARRAANAPVVRESAHREAPVASVAREVRTQRGTGRAGPPSSDVFVPADVPVEAPRRRPTERLARRTQAVGTLPTSMDDRRGFAAVEPVVASEGTRALRRVAARSVAGLPVPGAEERLALSPVGYVSTRRATPTRAPAEAAPARATRRAVASPSATFLSPAAAPEADATPAPARRRAAARPAAIAAAPVREAVEALSRANLPATRTPASVRAAARSAEPAIVGPRSALVPAAPTSYVASVGPELEAAPVAKAARRGVQRAVARAVAVAHADDRGAPMLSQAPVAHARSAPVRAVQASRPAVRALADVSQAQPVVSRQAASPIVSAPPAPGVARRVFQRVDAGLVQASALTPSEGLAAPVATTATARAALRSAPVVSRDGRGVRRLSADPTSYVHIAHHEPVVAAAEAVAGRRAPARRVVEAAPATAAAAEARRVVEPRSATVRAARRAAAPVVSVEARRGVLAPTPTRYVTASAEEVAAEAPAEAGRARATSRIAARADAPVALDDRGVGLVSRSATAYTRPEKASRRPLSASPVASLLEPARAAEIAAEPAGRLPRRAGVVAAAKASATKAARPARAAAAADESPRSARALPDAAIGTVVADRAPEGEVAAPRMAATRRAAARLAIASPEEAAPAGSGRVSAASPARRARPSRLVDALPARSMGAAGHALLRGELNAPEVADAAVMRAATGIVRDRAAQRRAVRPAMPHALSSTEFRWAIPVAAPVEAAPRAIRAREGAASGPVTREDLSGVLRRVTTAVRALERSDRTRLVTEGPQRLIAEAGLSEVIAARGATAGRSSARRAIRPTADGVLAQAVAPVDVEASTSTAPRARRAVASPAAAGRAPELRELLRSSPELREILRAEPRLRAVVRAEGRAAVAPSAIDGSAAPTVRIVRRGFAGTSGAAPVGMEHVTARGMAPATAAAGAIARYRTQRTAAGTFAPVSRADVPAVQPAFGLGAPGLPSRRMARVDAATGMVLPEPRAAAPIEAAAPAVRAGRAATRPGPGARAVARDRVAPARAADPRFAREVRPFQGTLGELSERAAAPKRGDRARPSRISADATTGAYFASAAPAEVDVDSSESKSRPAWAVRAIEGSLANPPASRDVVGGKPMATRVGTSGGLLVALARAERPEEVVQVILERSAQMRSLASELPQQAGALVTRLVEMGEREGAARHSAASSVAPEQQFLSVAPQSSSTSSGRSRSRRQSSTTAGSTQSDMGTTKVTKLAGKLMSLIHLAEAERKKEQGNAAYRMAADSSEARAEAAGPTGDKTPNENVNMKALQRDVLEAVLRELELTQQRRQEDPDGRSIWW